MLESILRKIRHLFLSPWRALSQLGRRATLVSPRHDYKLMRRLTGRSWPRLRQLRYFTRILSPLERRLWWTSLLVALASFASLAASAAAIYRVRVPAVGGHYTEGVVGAPRLVNPLFAGLNEVDTDLARLVYSGLMRYSEEQKLIKDLAVAYEVSPDKKTYTFSLNKNALWHDGEPLTAKDVAFTIEAIKDAAVGSPLQVSFQGVKVEALGDGRVRFALPEPFQGFLASLTVGIIPEHVWGFIPRAQMRLAESNLKPVGSGPYAFRRLIKDESGFITRYELTRFADYYQKPPYLKDFAFQFYNEYDGDEGAVTALRKQDISGLSFVPLELRERVKNTRGVRLRTLQLPQYTALFLNQKRSSALSDKSVRQALAEALDKREILKTALAAEGELVNGPILPGFPGYDGSLAGVSYDAGAANALLDKTWPRVETSVYREQRKKELIKSRLAEINAAASAATPSSTATTTLDSAGEASIEEQLAAELPAAQLFYRQNKSGSLLEVELVTADTKEYRQAAGLMAGYWQDIGVKTNIRYLDNPGIGRTVLKDRDYDALLYRVIVGGEPDQYPFWHSSQVSPPGLNLSGYENSKVDELLNAIRLTDDPATLARLYSEWQKIILDDLPAVFLYTPTYTYVLDDAIKGFDVSRVGHPADRFANVTEWYIKTDGRWRSGAERI